MTPEQMVDELGIIKAKIGPFVLREKLLKQALDKTGLKEVNGRFYRASIARFERDKVDMKAVRRKLSAQFLAAHTEQVPMVVVKVVAHLSNLNGGKKK